MGNRNGEKKTVKLWQPVHVAWKAVFPQPHLLATGGITTATRHKWFAPNLTQNQNVVSMCVTIM